MPVSWEELFIRWAARPSQSEQTRCENAVRVVKGAIDVSEALSRRQIKTFPQGSYHNRVNISIESDVDIGVLCSDTFFYELPDGVNMGDVGITPATYNYNQFKFELEQALINRFGRANVRRGNKAFTVSDNTYRLTADVVPLFEFRWYMGVDRVQEGVALLPDNQSRKIYNFPERLFTHWSPRPLHYENGVAKNEQTGRRFKGTVRIMKNLKKYMNDCGFYQGDVSGYLIECLVYNCPNQHFNHSAWVDSTKACLEYLRFKLASSDQRDMLEVDEIKCLFHDTQPWQLSDARDFVNNSTLFLSSS